MNRNPVEIRVISLQRADARRRLITAQFGKLSLPWSFFDAHTSLENPVLRYDPEAIRKSFGRALSRPELAVWSSHYSVIEKFLAEGRSEYLLVFEDDVIFDVAFPVRAMIDLCRDRDIHYIRLFGMYYADAVRLSFFYDRSIIRYKSSPAGAQAYIVSRTGAEQLLRACRRIEATVDLAIDHFWKTGLPIYSVFPFPVIERYSPTSVPMQPSEPLSRRDRAIWTANRVRERLRKERENRGLAAADGRFRKAALEFHQIDVKDVAGRSV